MLFKKFNESELSTGDNILANWFQSFFLVFEDYLRSKEKSFYSKMVTFCQKLEYSFILLEEEDKHRFWNVQYEYLDYCSFTEEQLKVLLDFLEKEFFGSSFFDGVANYCYERNSYLND